MPAPLDETFAFFADAANLERLTPPWINFRIRTPRPIVMREGAVIDYRIGLYGLPMPWRTRIDVWEPGVRFVDRQVAGPYRWWRHEHLFECSDGTRSSITWNTRRGCRQPAGAARRRPIFASGRALAQLVASSPRPVPA